MPHTRADLLARLDSLGIAHTTHEHLPVFTVEEARQHCSHLPGVHCKNLFLKDRDGRLWLVVVPRHRRVDLKRLGRRVGAGKVSFGKPELLLDVLGVAPGSVTPFAAINDVGAGHARVTVVLDAAMLDAEAVNYHPLDNTATTALAPADLMRFLRATGHEPVVLDFAGLEREPD
ncbi:MAG: prolyl-tRNA synthetase associated domain-containing protein [Alphaproteobacteria bacterium]|nr:prolyl-tRNA synthetase associated domain-containing protein [Alphaproteobacteria bacterium]